MCDWCRVYRGAFAREIRLSRSTACFSCFNSCTLKREELSLNFGQEMISSVAFVQSQNLDTCIALVPTAMVLLLHVQWNIFIGENNKKLTSLRTLGKRKKIVMLMHP